MYFYLFIGLLINFIVFGKGVLYLLEKLVESALIPLINFGYKMYNVPYALQLNKYFKYEDINDNIVETKKEKKLIDDKLD
jgi:hypothetical protein